MGGAAVEEHLAPVLWPQHLQVLLALVGVSHRITLPEDAAFEVTVFLHKVITAVRVLGEALGIVWLVARDDGVTGGEVGGVQEAAVPTTVVAPKVAMIHVTAQLLTDTGGLARYDHGEDDLGRVWLAPSHRDQGALGLGQGHQGQETKEIEHRH